MKGYKVFGVSTKLTTIFFALIVVDFLFAQLNLSGLWAPGYSWQIPDKYGPGIIAKNGGNLLFLSKDGELYELTMSGGKVPLGQSSGVFNVVAPPTYIEIDSNKKYVIYVTAQSTEKNKLVVHSFSSQRAVPLDIEGSAYGLVAYHEGNNIIIIFGTMNGVLYKAIYDTLNNTLRLSNQVTLAGPIKMPPLLTPDKAKVYVLTQNGKFYVANTSDLSNELKLTLSGEFAVPMAMEESGFVYALNSFGVLFRIDPSGNEIHAKFLSSLNSSGPLIDGDGFVYIFGDSGKVVVLNSSLLKVAEYNSINQSITTTPAIVKGREDGLTYLIIPSSASGSSGKITILCFNPASATFSKVWEFTVNSSFPLSAAVNVAPLGALYNEDYYFVTATNNGTVYAWRLNARGPYGAWAKYGQNTNNTGFIDISSMLFKTKIRLIALEGYSGLPLSSTILGSDYGLVYDALILNADGSEATRIKNLRTNEPDDSKIPNGVPGSQKLVVSFSTPTNVNLLLGKAVTPQGGSYPKTDATFYFRFWQTGQNGYEGSEGDNPATLTYRFSDRTINIYTNADYLFYVYHKYPNSESTESIMANFKYDDFKQDPTKAEKRISAITQNKYYAYKWTVYLWNSSSETGYEKFTYYDKDFVTLPLKGPAYIEVYYSELNATITMLVPEFAYGTTRAYLFLDAATDAVVEKINLKTLQGVKIQKIVSEEYSSVGKNIKLSYINDSELNIVTENFQQPLVGTTRVATIAVNLYFPQKLQFSGTNPQIYDKYFELYGYAQIRGQLVEPDVLRAKRVIKTNKYLFVVGDFDEDFDVDINDWNIFADKLGSTVSGFDIIYNIGPREDFKPPYPSYTNYSAGYLKDEKNRVDEDDLFIFATMFGFSVPNEERVR